MKFITSTHLVVREAVVAAEALYLCAYQRCFVEVLAFFLVLVDPQFGEHTRYLLWHEAAEDGIACILSGCGQYAHVELFVYREHFAYLACQQPPLVEAEIVDYYEENLVALVYQREHVSLEDVGRHQRSLGASGLLAR